MIEPTYRLPFACAMDNYEPSARRTVYGTLAVYLQNGDQSRTGQFELVIELLSNENASMADRDLDSYIGPLDKMRRAIYLIDDGTMVRPFYVSAWHDGRQSPMYPEGTYARVILREFPVDRPDKPGQFGTWSVGPAHAYHLKVRSKLRYV